MSSFKNYVAAKSADFQASFPENHFGICPSYSVLLRKLQKQRFISEEERKRRDRAVREDDPNKNQTVNGQIVDLLEHELDDLSSDQVNKLAGVFQDEGYSGTAEIIRNYRSWRLQVLAKAAQSESRTNNANDGCNLSRFGKKEPETLQCPESDTFDRGEIMAQEDVNYEYKEYFDEITKQKELKEYDLKGERYAFVMSNIKFRCNPGDKNRDRTFWGPEDAYQIVGLLKACDFKVTYVKDCKAKDFTQSSGRFSKWREWVGSQKPAAIVVVLMTHGDKGEMMEMSDGLWISYRQHVFEKFGNKENKNLEGVPKLFFLQCCRGAMRHCRFEDPSSRDDSTGNFQNKVEPLYSDMLIVYATLPGFKSERGWLISGLCEAIRRYGEVDDVITILIKLNAALRKYTETACVWKDEVVDGARPEETINVYKKHVCPFENIAFTKKFYFKYDKGVEENWRKEQEIRGVMRAKTFR